jgi:guanine nucleotide exchange factor VAV
MQNIIVIIFFFQNHEDSRFIENAKDAMVDVAQYINEVKRDADTLKIINDIEVWVIFGF